MIPNPFFHSNHTESGLIGGAGNIYMWSQEK